MHLLFAAVLIALSPVITSAVPQVPDSCPVTKPPSPPFEPPGGYQLGGEVTWIGTPKLWTFLPADGVWNGLGHYTPEDSRFRQKLFWWSKGYDWRTDRTELTITGERLDGSSPPLEADEHANAGWTNDRDHAFMVAGIFIPALGCWRITGRYGGEELSYVVWVSEECSANELLAVLKPHDPAYADAMALTWNLQNHGFVVKCVLQSKMVHTFEGQTGAAVLNTDNGDFEALFLPKGQTFDSLETVEQRENDRFLYSFQGFPRSTSPRPIDSKYPMFFEKHANEFFIVPWRAELAKKIAKALS